MIRNTSAAWGTIARFLHWVGAGFILLLVGHGWWMTEFAPRDARFDHYAGHASLGYALLALMIVRLVWRWGNAVPGLPGAPAWERIAAHVGHWALYVLTLAASIVGWALAGTYRQPMDSTLWGYVHVPAIVSGQDRALHGQLEHWHSVLSWTLAVLVALHVAAALYHLVVRKDGVMQWMLSSGTTPWQTT